MHELGDKALAALKDYNDGDLRGCHYILEKLWVESEGEKKHYIQGLVQVIAAVFKVRSQPNRTSAIRLLKKGIARLEAIDPQMTEVDIVRLMVDAGKLLEKIEQTPADRYPGAAAPLVPRIYFRD